ncbi:MAG: SsrA-binding protein SmpB [Opitutales bacterium]|nr:SsrA-binding protein SmpB [Opitutales bacterium]
MAKTNNPDRYKEIRNNRVFKDYFVDESNECGIVLRGTEVKSIRQGHAQIEDSFVRIEKGAPILYHAHIREYAFGTNTNHNPVRPRKLLLKKREILKWELQLQGGGKTLVPVKMYFKKGLVKVLVGLCRGKKTYDKRHDLKTREADREIERALKR